MNQPNPTCLFACSHYVGTQGRSDKSRNLQYRNFHKSFPGKSVPLLQLLLLRVLSGFHRLRCRYREQLVKIISCTMNVYKRLFKPTFSTVRNKISAAPSFAFYPATAIVLRQGIAKSVTRDIYNETISERNDDIAE